MTFIKISGGISVSSIRDLVKINRIVIAEKCHEILVHHAKPRRMCLIVKIILGPKRQTVELYQTEPGPQHY